MIWSAPSTQPPPHHCGRPYSPQLPWRALHCLGTCAVCSLHPASHHRGYTQIKLSSCLVCVRRGLCCCWLMGPLSALVFIEPKVNEGQSGDTRAASQEPWERRHVWWDRSITYQCCTSTSALLSGDTRPTQRAQAHGWVANVSCCNVAVAMKSDVH